MHERDWTGTAAALAATAMTVGVWLWSPAPPSAARMVATIDDHAGTDRARWQAEAARWVELPRTDEVAAAQPGQMLPGQMLAALR